MGGKADTGGVSLAGVSFRPKPVLSRVEGWRNPLFLCFATAVGVFKNCHFEEERREICFSGSSSRAQKQISRFAPK